MITQVNCFWINKVDRRTTLTQGPSEKLLELFHMGKGQVVTGGEWLMTHQSRVWSIHPFLGRNTVPRKWPCSPEDFFALGFVFRGFWGIFSLAQLFPSKLPWLQVTVSGGREGCKVSASMNRNQLLSKSWALSLVSSLGGDTWEQMAHPPWLETKDQILTSFRIQVCARALEEFCWQTPLYHVENSLYYLMYEKFKEIFNSFTQSLKPGPRPRHISFLNL